METQHSIEIRLDTIAVSTTNEMFRSKKDFSEKALNDLADSIKELGVIQPILVRRYEKNPESFILICGERRYRASLLAGKETIPAIIKDVSAEIALVLQITENMQREDVHPLNEAKGYKMLLEHNESMKTADLALKVGKSETYVLQRLKLNDLVREARTDFFSDKMNIGHATLLARLTPAAQREAINRLTNYKGTYGTVDELRQFIDSEIMNDLSQAPFDPLDESLVKKAGACLNCPKRSGAAPKLFAEIKEKDRCFDSTCFFLKCERFLTNKVREIIETKPDVVFLASYHDPAEKIMEMLTEQKLTPLKEHTDFFTQKTGGSKVKGLWISGMKAGKVETVHLKHEIKEAAADKGNVKVVVAKIEQRLERAVELDGEKVYAKILESLKVHPTQKKTHEQKILKDEEVFLWYVIYDKAGFNVRESIDKTCGLNVNKPEKFYEKLKGLSQEQRAFMLRKVMLDQYGGIHPNSDYAFIIRKIAESYGDIDITAFEKEQQEIRDKREARAKDRIKSLKKGNKENAKATA
ncbi:MAG: ParB/RepB/Spo0J family partition protein [Cyclobacteriaceae bacterium]